MQQWYAHGLPKQPELTEIGPTATTDKGENINPHLRIINLTWRWMAPPMGEASPSTGDNRVATKETEDAEMTDKAGGEPTGNPPATGTPTDTAGAR